MTSPNFPPTYPGGVSPKEDDDTSPNTVVEGSPGVAEIDGISATQKDKKGRLKREFVLDRAA